MTVPSSRPEQLTALVTGASSGIGRDLARLFAVDARALVLVARREQALETLSVELRAEHDVDLHVLVKDLTEAGAPQAVYETLENMGVHVDVLVNNAGFGLRGSFAELPVDRQLQMITLNVTALTALTRLFLPGMLARNQGGVLNVASTAAFAPGPFMAVYYATKAYVQSLTEALVEEVAHTDLRISCLVPGPTTTEFDATAGVQGERQLRLGRLPSEVVARAGYEGWRRGTAIIIPGAANTAVVAATRIAPRFLVRKVVSRVNRG